MMEDTQRTSLVEQQQQQSNSKSMNILSIKRCRVISFIFFLGVVLFFIVGAATKKGTGLEDKETNVSITCPGSPSLMHAKCAMIFEISDFMCHDVKEEIERRIQGKDNWQDPKSHPGKYQLLSYSGMQTIATRTTGDGSNYVDKFQFTYTDVQARGCVITGCSESQSTSYYDYSTNYCNMHNLICGSTENCKISRT